MSQFAASWAEARRRYTDVAGLDPDDSQFPHPSSIDELLKALEAQNQGFAEFRSRKGRFFHVLFEVSKPICIIASVASSEAGGAFPAAGVCLGALSHLMTTAKGVSSAYDNILDLLDNLKNVLVRLNIYERAVIPASLQSHFIEMLVTLMEIFAYSTKTMKKGTRERISRFAKNALLGDDGVISGLLAKLEVLSRNEDLLAGAETLVKTQQILDLQQKTNRDIQNVLENLSSPAQIQHRAEQQLNRAKSILQPSVNPEDIFQAISKKRVPGTGSWVRDQKAFKDWLDKKATTLCLAGSPGFGKSFIATSIITFLQEVALQSTEASRDSVAFFFFRNNNPQTRKINQCLRDLAFQIYKSDATFQSYFDSRVSSPGEVESPESIWREVFQNYFRLRKDAKGIYLIIDGLDEAFEEDRESLFNLLAPDSTSDHAILKIQIVLTGRQHVFNELTMVTNELFPTIHVDRFKNSRDMTQYINLSIAKSRSLARFPKLKKEIADTLTMKSQGMFLWVDLMIRELGHKSRPENLREALHRAPKGLNEKVRNVLENYSLMFEDEDEAGDFNAILSWVACAAEPLPLAVMDDVLCRRVGDEEGIPKLEERLRSEWGVLLDLNRDDGLTTDDLEGDPLKFYKALGAIDIQKNNNEETEPEVDYASNPNSTKVVFCHASIGEIFKNGVQGKVSSEEQHPAVGVDIAESAMITLRECLETICCKTQNNTKYESLRKYAIRRWPDHVKLACKHVDGVDDENLKVATGLALLKLFKDEDVMQDWLPEVSLEIFNMETLDAIIVIVKQCATAESIPSETRQWLEDVMARPSGLFLPSRRLVAKQWLQGDTWDTDLCIKIVHRVSCLENGQVGVDTAQMLSARMVLEAAESAGLEQNAEWHRRLAMSLREIGYFDDAEAHFQAAISLDERNWRALSGLARVEKMRGCNQEAVNLYKSSSEILRSLYSPETADKIHRQNLAGSYEDIGDAAIAAGDLQTALAFYKKSLDLTMGQNQVVVKYLTILPDGDIAEIVRVIKSLEVPIEGDNRENFNYLTSLFLSHSAFLQAYGEYWKVAAAFKSNGEIEWLEKAYRATIAVARNEQLPIIEFALNLMLADLFYVYDSKQEKALQIWKTALQFPATFMSSDRILKYLHTYVGKDYAVGLLRKAFDIGICTPEADQHLKALEEVCVSTNSLVENLPSYTMLPLQSLVLGSWKLLAGRREEGYALLRPFMQIATSGAYSDDKLGAQQRNYITSKILIGTGDEARAISLMQTYSVSEIFLVICYGRCGLMDTRWKGGYSCKICLVDLCGDCTEVLKQGGQLPVNVCSPNHSWVHIPGPDPPPKEGEICYNGEVISITKFYLDIWDEWQL